MGGIFSLLGYFIVMFVFMGIAIRTLQKKWFIIGAAIQLFALVGNTVKPGNSDEKIAGWIIYFVILLFTAFVMYRREKK